MKKTWISIKRGLVTSPKHREAIGPAIWLYLYILDRADWETGVVYDWRDADVATEMEAKPRTIRDWRQILVDKGYITCARKPYSLNIVVHKWVSPRTYSGQVLNDPQSDTKTTLSGDGETDTQGVNEAKEIDTEIDTEISRKSVTPTLYSNIKDHKRTLPENSHLSWPLAHGEPITEANLSQKYPHREKFPEPLVQYADAYFELTGQQPRKPDLSDWLSTFSEWRAAGVTVEAVRSAYKQFTEKSDWPVVRPGTLTKWAIAIASKPKSDSNQESEPTEFQQRLKDMGYNGHGD